MQRADWHRTQGHRLVIISASLGAYLRPIGERLRFDAVLATELEAGPDGRLTGRIAGENVRGPEKARRLDSVARWRDRRSCGRTATAPAIASCGRGPTAPCGSGAGRTAAPSSDSGRGAAARSGTLARMSEFLATLPERVLVFDGAFGTCVQDQRPRPPTTSAAPRSRAATSSSCSPGPTSSPRCTPSSSRSASTWSRPPPSARSPSSLDEYGIADETYEINEPAAAHRPGGRGRASPRPTGPASWSARSGPGTKLPSLGQIALRRRCATTTRCRRRACSRAASTCSSSRPCYDLLQAQGRDHRVPAGRWPPPGREVPIQVQVTIETTGPHARRLRDRRRAHRARRAAARRHRPQLRHRPARR